MLPGGILEFSWNLKALEGHLPWQFSDWILQGHGVPPRRLVGAGDGSLQPGYTILVVCLLTEVSGTSCLDLVLAPLLVALLLLKSPALVYRGPRGDLVGSATSRSVLLG